MSLGAAGDLCPAPWCPAVESTLQEGGLAKPPGPNGARTGRACCSGRTSARGSRRRAVAHFHSHYSPGRGSHQVFRPLSTSISPAAAGTGAYRLRIGGSSTLVLTPLGREPHGRRRTDTRTPAGVRTSRAGGTCTQSSTGQGTRSTSVHVCVRCCNPSQSPLRTRACTCSPASPKGVGASPTHAWPCRLLRGALSSWTAQSKAGQCARTPCMHPVHGRHPQPSSQAPWPGRRWQPLPLSPSTGHPGRSPSVPNLEGNSNTEMQTPAAVASWEPSSAQGSPRG